MTKSTVELLAALGGSAAQRFADNQRLAARLGVDSLLIFVRDPVLGKLLPAPGFPKTLPGGPSWPRFLRACNEQSRVSGRVEMPAGHEVDAVAIAGNGSAVVLLGGTPIESELAAIEGCLPLLAALLNSEQQAKLAQAEAAAAKDTAVRVGQLASALEKARARAAELNASLRLEHERKDSFLAMLGHELRNPLAVLVTSVELLRLRGDAPPSRELDVMSRQTAQLSRLVDDLLDVSRVSRGSIELHNEPVSLTDVIDAGLEEATPLLRARGHSIERKTDAPLIVKGDRARLIQIVGNLLNNAAKYTESGGRIVLAPKSSGHV